MAKYFPFSFSVDRETIEGLDLLARQQDRNRSQMLRILVKETLDKSRFDKKESEPCTQST